MNVSLTPELDQLVSQKISSGLYATPFEVVREALWLLDKQDEHQQAWLNETRAKIEDGLAQLERGEGIPGEQVFDELRRKSQQRGQGLAQV